MKMVKYAVCAALGMALAVGSVFAGGGRQQSGGDTQSQSGGAQAAKYTVTFAGTEAATTGQSRAMQEMADILNRDGRFEVSVQVAGALSGDTDNLVTQARTGVPLVVPTDPGRLASQFNIPDLNCLFPCIKWSCSTFPCCLTFILHILYLCILFDSIFYTYSL